MYNFFFMPTYTVVFCVVWFSFVFVYNDHLIVWIEKDNNKDAPLMDNSEARDDKIPASAGIHG